MKNRAGLSFHSKGNDRTSTGNSVRSGRICSEYVSSGGASSQPSSSRFSSVRRCGGRTSSTPRARKSSRLIWYFAIAAPFASTTRRDSQSRTNIGQGEDSITALAHLRRPRFRPRALRPYHFDTADLRLFDARVSFMPLQFSVTYNQRKQLQMPFGKSTSTELLSREKICLSLFPSPTRSKHTA